ncbi:MAG: VIT1/CCC1 transporter family protein [Sulfolobaceae archaeon]|nr:VIT1/CCC1 transporter family protein [Sulfolobaceae archaeon]
MEKGKEQGEGEIVHYINEADVFRTKVFGIQDGLIGVGSIVLGAAGFSHDFLAVVIVGLIATIGQAFSMGIGEYISTRVRMQVIDNEIKKEKYQIHHFPEKEREELISFYMKKGFSKKAAEKIADFLMKDKDVVLDEMLMNELRVFPEEFQSPVKLGFLMSLYLIFGGLLPIIPFIAGEFIPYNFNLAIIIALAIVILTLGFFGSLASKYTGLPKWRGAFEQIGTGLIALIGSYVAGLILGHFIRVPPIAFLILKGLGVA